MMNRLFKHVLMMAAALLLVACGKDPQPDPISVFSVLGDSFSALEGYVDPDTNHPWEDYPEIGVTGPEQMWWHQVATAMEWTMDRNNSFSGSLICNMDPNNFYGAHSFLRRMDDLGDPDVIFVFGGTNDIYNRVELGEYVYENWTEEQLCVFRPALACLFANLQVLYPEAEVYFMLDMDLCGNDTSIEETTRQAYIQSVHRIANHYHINCIDLNDIHKNWWHPDVKGQEDIARQVVEALEMTLNA